MLQHFSTSRCQIAKQNRIYYILELYDICYLASPDECYQSKLSILIVCGWPLEWEWALLFCVCWKTLFFFGLCLLLFLVLVSFRNLCIWKFICQFTTVLDKTDKIFRYFSYLSYHTCPQPAWGRLNILKKNNIHKRKIFFTVLCI